MSKHALIIGGGLGGLFCGYLLNRSRWDVTILEQGNQLGGALQTFSRDGIRFDTGFHSVGGLAPGEPLWEIFHPLGLMYLPWVKAGDDECIDGGPFMRLSGSSDFEIEHVIKPYQGSVWRLKGGGKTLVDALAKTQDYRLRKKVVSIRDREVLCSDNSTFRADVIVSAIHPRVTFDLVKDHVRSSYLKRLSKLEDGPGAVTLNCKLRVLYYGTFECADVVDPPGELPAGCYHILFIPRDLVDAGNTVEFPDRCESLNRKELLCVV